MKFLPHKQEDLSSSLRCHIKKSQVLWRVLTIPALGVINRSEKGGIPGVHWLARLAKSLSPRPMGDRVSKQKVDISRQ